MPECSHYARTMTCQNGPECLYLHLDASAKRPPCPHYERGFCPLGLRCANKHINKPVLCKFYLAGFCPNGKECLEGAHPRWQEKEDMRRPEPKIVLSAEQQEQERERLLAVLERERDEEAKDFQDRGFNAQRRGRGRGGRRFNNSNNQRRDNRF